MRGRSATRARLPGILLFVPLLTPLPPAATAAEDEPATGPGQVRYEFGFEERVRSENWSNLRDWNGAAADNVNQWRFRTRVWGKLLFGPRVELTVGLNNESKKVVVPDTSYRWDEVIFETFVLDWRIGDRWALRAGRQNVARGEAFLLLDGTSGDGSRTAYVNGLDLARTFGSSSKLELLAFSNPRTDEYLPVLNDRSRALTEWDERAIGLYFTTTAVPHTDLQAYYLYKTEEDDVRARDNPARQPDRRIRTFGGRVDGKLPRGFSVVAEAAAQWGRQAPDDDVRAWGGYVRAKKVFDRPSKPSVSLSWIALSGDDPATARNEGWDPLFSRWPGWSELYIYSLIGEKGVAYWTNLDMIQAEFQIAPWKPLALRATYYEMRAFHPFHGSPALFGAGTDRGGLFQARAELRARRHWRGHVLYERMSPGDFYAGTSRAYFFRVEAVYALEAKGTVRRPRSRGRRRSGTPSRTP